MMNRLFPRLTRPDTVQQVYERAAGGWQAGLDYLGFDKAYAAVMAHAIQLRHSQSTDTILDAGCGSGAFAAALLARTSVPPAQVDLLDLSPAMLSEARRRIAPEGQNVQGAMGDEVLLPGPYDRLLCAHVLEHSDDPLALLVWARRRIAPGGQIVLSVSKPHWCTALVRWRWGNHAFRPEEVETMLRSAGFEGITRHTYLHGPPSRVSCGYIATVRSNAALPHVSA